MKATLFALSLGFTVNLPSFALAQANLEKVGDLLKGMKIAVQNSTELSGQGKSGLLRRIETDLYLPSGKPAITTRRDGDDSFAYLITNKEYELSVELNDLIVEAAGYFELYPNSVPEIQLYLLSMVFEAEGLSLRDSVSAAAIVIYEEQQRKRKIQVQQAE